MNAFEQKFDVLLLDDSPEDRELFKRRLDALYGVDFSVTEAENTEIAKSKAENMDFDCYIIDYNLPDGNGLEFIRELQENRKPDGKNAAIIIVTGQGSEEIAAQAFKSGVQEYITKKSISDGFFARPVLNAIERTQMTTQLQIYRDQLEASNKALSEFVHTAAHDLKSPLRRIASFCEILEDDAAERLNDEDKVMLNRMMVNAKRMQELVNSLLSYSLISHEKEKLEETNLQTLSEEIIQEFEPQVKQSEAKITAHNLPTAYVFKARFYQLLSNLISNALKYSGDKTPEINISAEQEANTITFCVKDNGEGIPEGVQRDIFKDFKRLHTNEEIEGTGLGLSICKKIAKMHGGEIWVESKPGEGSEFYFTIRTSH